MASKVFQAKCITDEQIVKAVQSTHPQSHRSAIIALFPNVPPKVVAAKVRQAALKGVIVGCASDTCARAAQHGCGECYALPEVTQ